jgi:heat shock protein HslJ
MISPRFLFFALLPCAFFILTACGASEPPSPFNLGDTRWRLASIVEDDVTRTPPEGAVITLNLGRDGKASGTSGCNSYSGAYETQGEIIKFGALTTTLIACVDPALTSFEGLYLGDLYRAQLFEKRDNQLTLTFADGKGRLVFTAF